jgi:hypothetical protein
MLRATTLLSLIILAALIPGFQTVNVVSTSALRVGEALTNLENQVVALTNSSRAYNYDLELEDIAYRRPDFRSSGSAGANETAELIKSKFESFGMQAWFEPFQFPAWSLLNSPSLIIDPDGNQTTIDDQVKLNSFQCEHYSWFTPDEGTFSTLVTLPLPSTPRREDVGRFPINQTAWGYVNTTGKILFIGREVRMDDQWLSTFQQKLSDQPPAAIVFTFWNSWLSFAPDFFSSIGGLPADARALKLFWNRKIPVGQVNYEDGIQIRNILNANPSPAANVSIRAVIDNNGTHLNIVGKITGMQNPDKIVIISAHYDTIMASGFCDNGAGVAGIIELAGAFSEAIAKQLYKPNYTLLFVGFAGEELMLVGSANYVKQHKTELANVSAVINLDCIGSDRLYLSIDSNLARELATKMIEAAQDLGVTIQTEAPGGSDHESFLWPSETNKLISDIWGLDIGISDATPVAASAMLDSYPLFYSEKWGSPGTPGWIHTSYDNSTSTSTLDWVESDDLGDHIRVAALGVMRSAQNTIPEFSGYLSKELFVALFVVGFTLITIFVLMRVKKREPPSTEAQRVLVH